METNWHDVPPDMVQWGYNITYVPFVHNAYDESNYEETNLNWGIGYKTTSLLFKNVDIIKYKEKLRNCFKWKETKEKWHLTVTRDSGLEPRSAETFSVKDIRETIDEILVGLVY